MDSSAFTISSLLSAGLLGAVVGILLLYLSTRSTTETDIVSALADSLESECNVLLSQLSSFLLEEDSPAALDEASHGVYRSLHMPEAGDEDSSIADEVEEEGQDLLGFVLGRHGLSSGFNVDSGLTVTLT